MYGARGPAISISRELSDRGTDAVIDRGCVTGFSQYLAVGSKGIVVRTNDAVATCLMRSFLSLEHFVALIGEPSIAIRFPTFVQAD